MPSKKMSRRGLFRSGAALAAAGMSATLPEPSPAAPTHSLEFGENLYQSIGVTPLVNCRGTYTIITGSQTLPEVKRAMEAASHAYVHMDELMDAVSQRLADLTQAEWGIVTAGCAAALTHATSACIAGGDPEKLQRVPNLTGLKNEVVVPRYSRNEYDHAVRMLGVKMVEVETAAQFEAAIGPQTAMVMILSCPAAEQGEISIPNACAIARRKGVPVIVDAAAEVLTIPNIHLQHGANLVAYSGGKCLRGPQAAGLLLGQKDLVRAAWINSAPHHAFGRSLKVGKEEIMGMLAAVEMWVKRDQNAEWKQWQGWLDTIARQATQVPGVTSEILQPEDLSNHAPRLRLSWDAARLGITGSEAEEILLHGQPRIAVNDGSGTRRDHRPSSLTIMPYMMMPGDDKIAAAAIHKLLASPPHISVPEPEPPGVNVAGDWVADLTFVSGSSRHHFTIDQHEGRLSGTHHGDILSGQLTGGVEGRRVAMHSSQRIEGATLHYQFSGDVSGNRMEGVVQLGEYGQAKWSAQRT
ncbi:MAG TPA: aminotransferase class V-fold PLP-dependent enzyme [Bryobacteraceae bacterium]|nr:aminotransferase class V-fold PLP-dependent enzyme [Bryobacteraceae bacterium]